MSTKSAEAGAAEGISVATTVSAYNAVHVPVPLARVLIAPNHSSKKGREIAKMVGRWGREKCAHAICLCAEEC